VNGASHEGAGGGELFGLKFLHFYFIYGGRGGGGCGGRNIKVELRNLINVNTRILPPPLSMHSGHIL